MLKVAVVSLKRVEAGEREADGRWWKVVIGKCMVEMTLLDSNQVVDEGEMTGGQR